MAALAGVVAVLFAVINGSEGNGSGDSTTTSGGGGQSKSVGKSDGGDNAVPKTYTVQPGDTLSGIAEQFGISEASIQKLNKNVDPQALATGQELKLR